MAEKKELAKGVILENGVLTITSQFTGDVKIDLKGYKGRLNTDLKYIYDPSKPKKRLPFNEVTRFGHDNVKEFWIVDMDTAEGTKVVDLDPRAVDELNKSIDMLTRFHVKKGLDVPSTWILTLSEDESGKKVMEVDAP